MARAAGWWDDPAELHARLALEDDNVAALSRATGVPQTTLKSARSRHEAAGLWPKPGETAGTATFTTAPGEKGDLEALMRSRGLDPQEWVAGPVVVNEWGDPEKPSQQLKVTLRPKLTAQMLTPAEPKPLTFAKVRSVTLAKRSSKPRLVGSRVVFVYGDDQRPNHDVGFEQAKLAWIAANQPDTIVDLGDGMDFATVSQYKPNPAHNHSVQDCANSYASWLYTARLAAPDAEIVVLADNHVTQRWRDYQLSQAAALYGVKPAEIAGLADDLEPLLSIRRLLRLDEMNVQYLAPAGDTHYAESQYEIVPGELVALHGYRTGNNVGRKLLDDFGVSVVYGHVHGQDVTVTDQRRRGIGDRKRLYALGVGCGATVAGGIGFAPGADWQNCCLVITVHDDGGWTWDYLNYEHGVLRWRDQRYEAAA